MKITFFAIVITLFSKSVIANTDPILLEKHGKATVVFASLPAKLHEEVIYNNGKAIRTADGTYLFVKSASGFNETVIFFRENSSTEWKTIGRVCANLSAIRYLIKNYGWQLEVEVDGNGCKHVYEKVLTLRGAEYREVK